MKAIRKDIETMEEALERIEKLGTPKADDPVDYKRRFKFRVSFTATIKGARRGSEGSFAYHDYETARRCYRKILLAFYRGKQVESFAICLNRHSSKKWAEPLHSESDAGNA